MTSESFNFQSLFKKYLQGTATAEEIREVFKRIGEGKSEKEILSLLDTELVDTEQQAQYDEKRWALVFERIKTETVALETEKEPNRKTAFGFMGIGIAAATVLIVAGLYFVRENAFRGKTQDTVKTVSQIKPGGNKAVLTLADGKQIVLSEAKNGGLANEQNTLISKTADGEVLYESSGTAAAAMVYNTMTTPIGGQYALTLSDGTKVTLNAASSLRYPTNFTGSDRRVELTGEGYFEVAHDKSKPFRVISGGQQVQVLGTHFNIMAYGDDKVIKTTLVEGSVKITATETGGTNGRANAERILKPGEQGSLYRSGTITVEKTDIEEAIAWKNGKFVFDDEPIENIMRALSRWYNLDVTYIGEVRDRPFTVSIGRYDDISKILDKIAFTQKIHFKIEGRRIAVMN